MGQQMDRAREVLAVTERRSILEMYRNEFRQVRGASKSETSKQLPPKKPEDAIAQSNRVAEIAYVLADRSDGRRLGSRGVWGVLRSSVPAPCSSELLSSIICFLLSLSSGRIGMRRPQMNLISLADRPAEPSHGKRVRLNPDRKLLSLFHSDIMRARAKQFHSGQSRLRSASLRRAHLVRARLVRRA